MRSKIATKLLNEMSEEQKKKVDRYANKLVLSNVMWRLSAIIFLPIVMILAITYMPIKWLLSGKYFLNEKGWTNWLYKWGKKIGFD